MVVDCNHDSTRDPIQQPETPSWRWVEFIDLCLPAITAGPGFLLPIVVSHGVNGSVIQNLGDVWTSPVVRIRNGELHVVHLVGQFIAWSTIYGAPHLGS